MKKFHLGETLNPYSNTPLQVDLDLKGHGFGFGATGAGKTSLLMPMVKYDFFTGKPVFVVEPHGEFADECLKHIPYWRSNKVVIIDPSAPSIPGINPFNVPDKTKAVEAFIDMCLGLWGLAAFGPRSQYIVRNFLKALLFFNPNANPLHLFRMLADDEYAKAILEAVIAGGKHGNLSVFYGWYAKLSLRDRIDMLSAPLNKLDMLVNNEYARAMFGHPRPLDFGKLMNENYIVIVRLSKGDLGEEMTQFFLSIILHLIVNSAFERTAIPPAERQDVRVYVDEFHNVTKGQSAQKMLAELRKYGVFLFGMDQASGQLAPEVVSAIRTNVNYLFTGRVEPPDAEQFAKDLNLGNPAALTTVERGHWWVKIVEDGKVKQSRLVKVAKDPPHYGGEQDRYEVIKQAKRRFTRPRLKVLDYTNRILNTRVEVINR